MQASDITRKRKRLAAAQKRAGELEKLICKIYEDNVLGKLPDTRYASETNVRTALSLIRCCVAQRTPTGTLLYWEQREYLGHTINFKTRKHFKDKKSHYVDENEWVIFEDTHTAIIDPETFENVQRIRSNVKRYPDGWGEAAPLTGLLYCSRK